MTEFVPHGYMPIREALNHLGRERFPAQWTSEEHKARTRPMPGPGMSGGGMKLGGIIIDRPLDKPVTADVVCTAKSAPTNPYEPSHQDDNKAAERFETVSHQLRVLLEAGELQAVIWDPFNGALHPVPARMWRQNGADRMIKSGRAQIPPSGNIGPLLVKVFLVASPPSKPMPTAKIAKAVAYLTERRATESLTRPQQAELVRKLFSDYHVTQRQLMEIFRGVPVRQGRPTKSNKKV